MLGGCKGQEVYSVVNMVLLRVMRPIVVGQVELLQKGSSRPPNPLGMPSLRLHPLCSYAITHGRVCVEGRGLGVTVRLVGTGLLQGVGIQLMMVDELVRFEVVGFQGDNAHQIGCWTNCCFF